MKRPLQLPLQDYDRMKAILDAQEHVDIDRNAWKRDEWKDGEDVGKHLPCIEKSRCLAAVSVSVPLTPLPVSAPHL